MQSHPSGEATSSLVLLCIKERYCLRFDTDNSQEDIYFSGTFAGILKDTHVVFP